MARARRFEAVRSARARTQENLQNVIARRLLVVCYGNIYRSPFVEEQMRQLLPAAFQVRSGGFHSVPGRLCVSEYVQMCREFGVELSGHRSRIIERADLDWADLILLMDSRNWLALRQQGVARSKLVWLGSVCPGAVEIPDPYGKSPEQARAIVGQMRNASLQLARRLGAEPVDGH